MLGVPWLTDPSLWPPHAVTAAWHSPCGRLPSSPLLTRDVSSSLIASSYFQIRSHALIFQVAMNVEGLLKPSTPTLLAEQPEREEPGVPPQERPREFLLLCAARLPPVECLECQPAKRCKVAWGCRASLGGRRRGWTEPWCVRSDEMELE